MPLELTTSEEGGVMVVAVVGQVDSKSAPELERLLVKLTGEGKRELLLDLEKLDYVASAGLRVFVMIGKRLTAAGGRLALCAVNASVYKVLEISGFVPLFPIRPSRAEAVSWLGSNVKLTRITSLAAEILHKEGGQRPRAAGAADAQKSSYAADLLDRDQVKKPKK